MGKDNLIIGTARGKLGDVVFYRTGGEQRFRTRVRPNNPRTNAQLIQRIVVSTAVKGYSIFSALCDHSFQNYIGKLKNHQRFMRLNIKWMREMALSQIKSWDPISFSNTSLGNWSGKDGTDVMLNSYIISEGDLTNVPVSFAENSLANNNKLPYFMGYAGRSLDFLTYRNLCELYNLPYGAQLTFVWVVDDDSNGIISRIYYSRVILMPASGNMDAKFFNSQGEGFLTINDPNPENYGQVLMSGLKDDIDKAVFMPMKDGQDLESIKGAAIISSAYQNEQWRRSNTRITLVNGNGSVMYDLRYAMNTYRWAQTSSLYLNQSVDAEIGEVTREATAYDGEDETMFGEPIEKNRKSAKGTQK